MRKFFLYNKYAARFLIMNRAKVKHEILFFISFVVASSWLSYTIMDQQKQIEQLQEQLQHEQMKYKIIINDPLVRDAMESGG